MRRMNTSRNANPAAPTTALSKAARGELDGRTKPVKAFKAAESSLLTFIGNTKGRAATPLESIAAQQLAWLLVVDGLFRAKAMEEASGGLNKDGLPDAIASERWSAIQTKLGKALMNLAKLLGTSPSKLQDGFADALDSLKVAVPVGSAGSTTPQKPKRGTRKDG